MGKRCIGALFLVVWFKFSYFFNILLKGNLEEYTKSTEEIEENK